MESPTYKWMRTGGSPIAGNLGLTLIPKEQGDGEMVRQCEIVRDNEMEREGVTQIKEVLLKSKKCLRKKSGSPHMEELWFIDVHSSQTLDSYRLVGMAEVANSVAKIPEVAWQPQHLLWFGQVHLGLQPWFDTHMKNTQHM